MRINHLRLAAGFAAVGLLLAACSESDTKTTTSATTVAVAATTPATTTAAAAGTTTTAAATAAPSASTTAATGTGAATTAAPSTAPAATTATTAAGQDLNAWALTYTGGKAGAASGDPIKIGYANDDSFFPENTIGINAAVAYVNGELGGAAGGRPLQIVPCQVTAPDSGSKCGAQFANDASITLVVTGTMQAGNKELYAALDKKKPVIIGNGITTDDFTTPAGQAFTAGSPGVVVGMDGFVISGLPTKPKNVVIAAQNNPASKGGADLLVLPVLKAAGMNVTEALVDDSAPESDMQAALTAAGADKADVIISVNTIQQCINLDDAIRALSLKATVVATGLCFGTPMTDHLTQVGVPGTVPDGWYFGDYGYSYFSPDYDSGMMTYLAKVQQYGKPAPNAKTIEYTGFAGPSFSNILTATKFFNALGPDKLDFASVDAQIRGFKGPMMLQVGPLDCGHIIILKLPIFISVCASQMGIHQYKGGQWVTIADGVKGNPIDASKVGS